VGDGRLAGQGRRGEERSRLILFVVVSLAILASALLFRTGHRGPAGIDSTGEETSASYAFTPQPSTTALMVRLREERLEVADSARRFLAAFFHYEVGETGTAVQRALRATSTRGFYRRLLQQPVAAVAAGGFPARASLERMRISFVSSTASRALVTGTAKRASLPEEFSFVFSRGRAGWLASAPGE
jgi:hypothetical protein